MPSTRSSGRAFIHHPSITSSGHQGQRTRQLAAESETSSNEVPTRQSHPGSSVARRLGFSSAQRSHGGVSDIYEDRDATPRAHAKIRNRTPSLDSSSTSSFPMRHGQKRQKRLHVRPSLTGPHVEEMTIERRAEMVADVAGDCLVKLVRAGLQWNQRSRKGDEDWRKIWQGLQCKFTSHSIFSRWPFARSPLS